MNRKLFTADSERLIVALDFTPDRHHNPVDQAQLYLEQMLDTLSGLNITLKINTVARILGARAIELIHDNGFACFLDLKLFDIQNTLENDAEWIRYHLPLMLTVAERIKPSARERLEEILPETLILPVGPLTDLTSEDFHHFEQDNSRHTAVKEFFFRIWKAGYKGAICAPTDIELAPIGFRSSAMIITPAVKPAWSLRDNNSENALTPELAIRAGADAIVVGRGITAQENIREAAKRTLEEMSRALP